MGLIDNIINECDIALKTLSNSKPGTNREYPVTKKSSKSEELTKQEKSLSIQMMRVNLAGEVAAQALYRGQAMVCKDQEIKKHLIEAGEEETDHLIWCKRRLDELDGRSSVFNPIWYAGSFAIGHVNCDALFSLCGQSIDQQRKINLLALCANFFAICFKLGKLVFKNHFAVIKQTTNQR